MAVYTDVSDAELSAFLDRYDMGALLSCKGIAEGVENSNYFVHTEGGNFILTLYEKRVSADDLPFFIGLMDHLASRGLNCPRPVRDRAGEALGTLNGRPAALVTFLDGVWIKQPSAEHCGALGRAMAELHRAGADFPLRRPNGLSVDSWPALFAAAGPGADGVAPGLSALVREELAVLADRWPRGLPEGVVHADLFPDNVFFLGDRLSGLIDFYFACTDALSYDLAVCLNAWCFAPDGAFDPARGRALLDGYRAVRPLSAAEVEALPVLARGAALRFMLTRLVDWLNVPPGALVRPKDPKEYLAKLRFHRTVSSAEAYGFA
ncbi:homoserine kinase [Lichenibacterium minor]|uniref:Homoserine kinase n=1 Tax=Lichenibacterium minor TaxID=2316528 RepID=A0A4Q2UCN7_9HYPH|nr:homoserine kinase [Lichenibacterium minor]RYC32605.1 homoserine kinase [Lichenibacterium minor]